MLRKMLFLASAAIAMTGSQAQAATCVGTCGVGVAEGDITAPPAGTDYQYVSTFGGVEGFGAIADTGAFNGSEYITDAFAVTANTSLGFFANFISSDGGGFDYGFAELLRDGVSLGYLFTAKTTDDGEGTVPALDLPVSVMATLSPATGAMIAGATNWSPLGASSAGGCYVPGCGNTGWIASQYTITQGGNYQVRFGVTNIDDDKWNSGLAFSGLKLVPGVSAVPEPGTWGLMMLGLGAAGYAARRRSKVTARVAIA